MGPAVWQLWTVVNAKPFTAAILDIVTLNNIKQMQVPVVWEKKISRVLKQI